MGGECYRCVLPYKHLDYWVVKDNNKRRQRLAGISLIIKPSQNENSIFIFNFIHYSDLVRWKLRLIK